MERPTSALCLACGLCCTAALHAAVEVKPEHVTLVRNLGLTVEHVEGTGIAFRQPCVLYRDTQCSAYPNHPPSCQEYRCALLKKYERGEIERPAALALVSEARALVAQGGGRPLPAGEADPGALLRAAALDVLLTKHFR